MTKPKKALGEIRVFIYEEAVTISGTISNDLDLYYPVFEKLLHELKVELFYNLKPDSVDFVKIINTNEVEQTFNGVLN